MGPRPRRAVALALAAALASAGCGGGGGRPAAATPATVDIRLYAFMPGNLTIDAGQSVTWVERDDDIVAGQGAHSIVFDDGSYDSGLIRNGASATFAPKATATYHCGVHNYMTGTITVR